MRVLGIESSCDEMGMAIYDSEYGLLSHVLYSQIKLHSIYGGIVPELASRDHIKRLIPLMDEVLLKAKLKITDIDAVAYTAGPGLVGSLLVGACFAKSLAYSLNKPSLAINHLEAHLLSVKLDYPNLDFPFLGLLVSGGHTQLVEVYSLGNYCLLGNTLDDSVGEVFDKIARMMGIMYPGGSVLAEIADSFNKDRDIIRDNDLFFKKFPRPMIYKSGLDFSFSGLKTYAVKVWNKSDKDEKAKKNIAKLFQDAVIDTIVIKCKRAIKKTLNSKLVVVGGVSANRALREALTILMKKLNGDVFFPRLEYCTDNGAMVAYIGCQYFLKGIHDCDLSISVNPRWSILNSCCI
ncbi:tRNA (adenosine(37)-N6)-threonylcarbamoyltransferase complex transferase subunit TsaD [Candidatus Legionella polyplacis]|uniref:tRNA N6-adenosine threonylcarbamoyltransferase n=1 Tax=Candidatus Legionella polyplacis TaxID=2005262 RepID=A0ABZ2GYX0_9GAMM